ncbi:MAG: hypothetical protein IPF52_16465 [Saprospiraceae bacterium]|nr:hypothetical protein [Saprospiraceae bacterium]
MDCQPATPVVSDTFLKGKIFPFWCMTTNLAKGTVRSYLNPRLETEETSFVIVGSPTPLLASFRKITVVEYFKQSLSPSLFSPSEWRVLPWWGVSIGTYLDVVNTF